MSRPVLQEVVQRSENDENLPGGNLQDRPTDDDRARFGFKPKQLKVCSDPIAPSAAGHTPVDFQQLLRRTLGDPDDLLPVLRLKPTAGKYDFKDKIQDLQAMIGPLKNSLSDQRLKAKALVEALLSMESSINQKLRCSVEEVTSLQSSLNEVSGQLSATQLEVLQLRQEQPQLRQHAEQSKRREDQMAQKLSEAQRTLDQLDKDLAEARKVARSFSDDASKYKRRCEEMHEKHRAQMEEAADLLRQQVNETIQAQQQLSEAHQRKEASLLAEFEKSREEMCKEHRQQLNNSDESSRRKEAEAKAKLEALKEQHRRMLQEKDELLENKEAEAKANMEALKEQHRRMLQEKDELLENKEVGAKASSETLKEQHRKMLQEKEAAATAHAEALKEQHRKTLQEKELEAKASSQALKEQYKKMLHEKDELLENKDLKMKDQAKLMRTHSESLQRQLLEKESTLKDTLTSLQLLQNSSSDQLRLEQQRVQKLEVEVEELRNRSVVQLQRLEHSEADLKMAQKQLEEQKVSLQRLESDKELQAERASEKQAALQEQIIQLNLQAKAFEEEASHLKASLEVRISQCEKLTCEKNGLEVEFRSYKEHHGTSNQQQMEAITDLKLTVDKLSKQVDNTKSELQLQQTNLSQRQGYIISLENQLAQAELTRRELHNIIQELKGNIRVFCRVRPSARGTDSPALQSSENKVTVEHLSESYNFSFDRVFDASSTQEAVFEEVDGLVQSALDGYKVCIFAYGQTGSGKTFTMQGDPACNGGRGLIPRCLAKILQCSEAMRAAGWEWTLKVSFLEVYNEVLRDLLEDGHSLVHVIKHDEAYGTMVTNLTTVEVKQMEHIHRLMDKAAKARAVGATDMNATSSRSHSVFAMYLHGVNRELNSELTGALHLVDLAGSERLEKSGSTGDRLKETQNINKSLSSLADVFLAKSEGRSHIPFRNSKLTHLMEPCLNGQGKTLMVVNVGPEAEHAHESLCSLRFASQVSQCNTGGKPKRCVRPAVREKGPNARTGATTARRK